MKNILYVLLIVFVYQNQFAVRNQQLSAHHHGAKVYFQEVVHDFDTIQTNSDGICYFTFKNTGDRPLIIASAKTSCGCTASTP